MRFLLFFVVVFFSYWILQKKGTKIQNAFLLVASYFFYGYANWKMLPLIVIPTIVFYFLGIGIGMSKTEKCASWLTVLGVVMGVVMLLYFKYLGFFISSFSSLFESMGLHTNWHAFNIIMPLGISYFSFKLISYVVEIHRDEIEPTLNFVDFATYIAFFPCIVSGPIDRPQFISQLEHERKFNYGQAVDGMRQILWGLFKKIVVADSCAIFVDMVFSTYTDQSGSSLLLAAIFYTFQVYADFSGYSDMAIGVGKLLGFNITRNFNYPFFAMNVADFWRRWHISLTSWMTDYVFMPLNFRFRDWGRMGMILAIVINMVLVGMWHGANWTFAVYGLYHGLLFIPLVVSGAFMKKAKIETNRFGLPVARDAGRMLLTFMLIVVGMIIFRVDSIRQAGEYFQGMMQFGTLRASYRFFVQSDIWTTSLFIVILLVIEWLQRSKPHGMEISNIKQGWLRFVIYFALILLILDNFGTEPSFIYSQF